MGERGRLFPAFSPQTVTLRSDTLRPMAWPSGGGPGTFWAGNPELGSSRAFPQEGWDVGGGEGDGGGLLGSSVGRAVEILSTRWRWASSSSPSHPRKQPDGVWETASIHHVRVPGLSGGYSTTGVTKAALTLWPLLDPFIGLALVGRKGRSYYRFHFYVHLRFHLSAFMEPGLGTDE